MNNSLNVLFLASWYPAPEYPTHGIFIRNHAKALAHYCHVIVMYVYSSDEINETVLEHTQTNNLDEYIVAFPKSKIPFLKNIIHLFKYIYYYYKLSRLVKKHFSKIHFAQINVVYPVALFFPLIKKLFKIKTYTVFEQWTGYLKEDNLYNGLLRKTVTRQIISKASKVWCLCEYQRDSMLAHQLSGNYEILGNVVNTELFACKRTPHSKKRFIHVSTLDDRQKNISGILRVFKELENEGYDFELIVIGGKGDNLKNAIQYARHIGLKNAVFKGILPQEDLPKWYQSADALVMFSNYETFCVAVYEALSCGTYVITTNVADLDKIITDKFGAVVLPGNEMQLKEAVQKVLEGKITCASEEAHNLIEQHFSEIQIGKKLFEYYSSIQTKQL